MGKRVVITGGNGCLGQRLAQHLIAVGDFHVVLLDDFAGFHRGRRSDPVPEDGAATKGSFEHVQANLAQWADSWASAFEGAQAVVHFAAVNPYPEASWEDSRLSTRMAANVVAAAQRAKVRRVVVASSSHVLGGYLQEGARLAAEAPELGPGTPLKGFTRFRLPGFDTDASAYAAAKLAMEETLRAAALSSGGELSAVIVRIGWCQPGENRPQQMSATATPTISADHISAVQSPKEEVMRGFDDRRVILAWLHRLWLSTRDFRQLFQLAIEADVDGVLDVCGMSQNGGMRWSTKGWAALGYQPLDDAEVALGESQRVSEPDAKRPRLA